MEVLAGGGPPDVVELTLALAREMLDAAGLADVDPADGARRRAGHGLVAGHGPRPGRRPGRAAARGAARSRRSRAGRDGFVATMDAYAIGVAAWRLGAGRARKEDPVSAVGRRRPAPPAGRRGPGRRRALELRADDAGQAARGAAVARGRDHAGGARRRPCPTVILDRIS